MSDYYLSFDVEDWFHSHNLRPAIDRDQWDDLHLRVDANTRTILNLLDEHDTKATFFVLGYVAERVPELVEEIARRGHEVESHGYNHDLLHEQSRDAVRADLRKSKSVLESIIDQPVTGYRAPSFSITDRAIELLDDLGYEYDSSRFAAPVHDRYGSIEVEDDAIVTTTGTGFTEIQLPLYDRFGVPIPWAGGGYFRFLPYRLYRHGVEYISRSREFVFYLHPWELDPDQPRVSEIPLSYRLRHYRNLDRTEPRLDRLLSDFDWKPLGSALQ